MQRYPSECQLHSLSNWHTQAKHAELQQAAEQKAMNEEHDKELAKEQNAVQAKMMQNVAEQKAMQPKIDERHD